MAKDKKLELLEQVPLFRACSPRELETIASITDETSVSAGTVVAEKGRPGHEFFLILTGTAKVQLPDQEVTLGPGEFFGEMSLLDNEPRVATVVAETDLDLLVLGSREFSTLIADVPAIARNVMKVLAQRLRALEAELTH